MIFAVYYTMIYLAHDILRRLNFSTSPMNGSQVYRGEIPIGMYLSRNHKVNPKVFVQWGQETAEFLRLNNFCDYGLFEFNESKTVFMRNIRLTLTEKLYNVSWPEKPYKLAVEAYNSYTGRTSFDMTIHWYFDGDLIATLVRKMVYVSATTGKPIDLPAKFTANNPGKSNIRFSLNKDVPISAGETTLTVRPSDLDFNDHVGHPVYVDYLLDSAYHIKYQYLPTDLLSQRIRTIDIEYKYPVVLGRQLVVRSWDEDQSNNQGLQVNFVMSQRGILSGEELVCLGKFVLYDS